MAELTDVIVLPTVLPTVMLILLCLPIVCLKTIPIKAINGKQAEYNSAGENVVLELDGGIKSKRQRKQRLRRFIQSISILFNQN